MTAHIIRGALKELARTTDSARALQGAALLATADDATLERLGRLLK